MNSVSCNAKSAQLLVTSLFFTICLNVNATTTVLTSDFENNTSEPWNILSWGGTATRKISSLECAPSSGCLLFRVSSQPDSVVLRQDIETVQGTEYMGSAWLRAEQNTFMTVRIRKNDPPYTIWGQRTVQVGKEWQTISFRAAAGDSSSARMEFSLPTTNINTYIDNISLSVNQSSLFDQTDSHITIEKSLFGMHLNKGHVVNEWAPVNSVNVGLIRLWDTGTDWAGIEKEKDNYDWIRLDLYLDRADKYIPDAKIIYTFGRVPGWANGGNGISVPPLDINDWKDFVTQLVNRHGSKIDYYELWNEFDYSEFWDGTVEQLLELNKEAFNIIKAVDPTAKILMPSITNNGLDKLDKYLSIGGGRYADAASIHIYTSDDDLESSFLFVNAVKDLLSYYKYPNIPIFNTEGAVILSKPAIDVQSQPSSVSKYYLMSAVLGLVNSNWYFWENTPTTDRVELVSDFQNYDKITPAGIAYKETANWLIGTKIKNYSNDKNGLHIIELQRGATPAGQIIWSETGFNGYTPADHTKIAFARRLDGAKTNYTGQPITITGEPVFLEYYIPPVAPALLVE
jgi:hypothetical protein